MAPGQEMVSDPVVSIGDRTLIGQGSYIVGHFCIEIGDDIQTGPYVYITDQNHTYADPDIPIGRQWPVESSVSDRVRELARNRGDRVAREPRSGATSPSAPDRW